MKMASRPFENLQSPSISHGPQEEVTSAVPALLHAWEPRGELRCVRGAWPSLALTDLRGFGLIRPGASSGSQLSTLSAQELPVCMGGSPARGPAGFQSA